MPDPTDPSAAAVVDRAATLEDVARLAGVSRQTVSNAVNAPHLLRTATLARVSAAAERLDYRPNAAARAMRTGQAGVLAVRVGAGPGSDRALDLTGDEHFLPAFTDAACRRGRAVVAITAADDAAEADRYTALVAGLGLDGVLVAHDGHPCAVADTDPRLRWLAARRVRGVLVGPGTGGEGGPLPRVDVDVEAGFRTVTARLAGQGHRRIALVGPGADGDLGRPAGDGSGTAATGWAAAMTAAGLDPAGLAVGTGDDLTAVRATVARVVAREPRPTALLCTSAPVAAACHAELTAWGLAVGDDVALVGVGDGLALRALDVATLAVPAADLAAACVDLLLRRTPIVAATGAPETAPVVRLVPHLDTRGSFEAPTGADEL